MTKARPDAPARVRLYHQVRTAHLERAAQLPPATILFGSRRYDFDEALAAATRLVPAAGPRAAWWLFRHPPLALEINEPLSAPTTRWTALALAGLRLGNRWHGHRTRVVTYAIENLDPARPPRRWSLKSRLARGLDARLRRLIWAQLDRVVYGTDAAAELYRDVLPARAELLSAVIPALPQPDPAATGTKDPHSVVFLGALSERKGFRQVLAAWPAVVAAVPDARLQIIGKGVLEPLAVTHATPDRRTELVLDPPRERIRGELDRHQVLVLPAQPSPTWREQVGLPLVEGLSYGCTVVTTAETGLADWLAAHGHQVLDDPGSVEELAGRLVAALREPLDVAAVLASLPPEDGRLGADDWLFDGVPTDAAGTSAREVLTDVA